MFNNMSGSHSEFRISGMGVNEDPKNVFRIDPNTGIVYALKKIDRETHKKFHVSQYKISNTSGGVYTFYAFFY